LTAGKDRSTKTAGTVLAEGVIINEKKQIFGQNENADVFFGMLVIMLAFGLVLTGCGDSKTGDPGSPPGGKNSGKPTELAPNATHAEAAAKLDEIIAYPETPDGTKEQAQGLKKDMPQYSLVWGYEDTAKNIISFINVLIDQIPSESASANEDDNSDDPGNDNKAPGGNGDGKPAELAPNATHAEAMAKLDEIIAYSETPEASKDELRELKEDIDPYASFWDYIGPDFISQITDVIKQLP
jgi:hypothetical protein